MLHRVSRIGYGDNGPYACEQGLIACQKSNDTQSKGTMSSAEPSVDGTVTGKTSPPPSEVSSSVSLSNTSSLAGTF